MSKAQMTANLSQADAGLYFRLMWALQSYVNARLGLLPGIKSAAQYAAVGTDDKLKVREALWQHSDLLEAFVGNNPAGLSPEELRIVQGWQQRVMGDFYVLRFLKRYAVFLSADKAGRLFGVLGLYDRLEDVLGHHPLPIMVEAVLLPFKGRIIYDGLLSPYAITFGPGIRGDLNEIYQRARQQDSIVESLEPDAPTRPPARAHKPKRDWLPVLDGLVATAEQLRQAETVVQTRAFGVLKASARLAQAAARDPDDLDELYELARRTQVALRQLETALSRAE
jgi:hypothetical protein